MRIEPKMYESTKPKDADVVDTAVVAEHIVDDGLLDMVSRFFKWIGDNVEFEEYKLDNDENKIAGYTYAQHMAMGDPYNIYGASSYYD